MTVVPGPLTAFLSYFRSELISELTSRVPCVLQCLQRCPRRAMEGEGTAAESTDCTTRGGLKVRPDRQSGNPWQTKNRKRYMRNGRRLPVEACVDSVAPWPHPGSLGAFWGPGTWPCVGDTACVSSRSLHKCVGGSDLSCTHPSLWAEGIVFAQSHSYSGCLIFLSFEPFFNSSQVFTEHQYLRGTWGPAVNKALPAGSVHPAGRNTQLSECSMCSGGQRIGSKSKAVWDNGGRSLLCVTGLAGKVSGNELSNSSLWPWTYTPEALSRCPYCKNLSQCRERWAKNRSTRGRSSACVSALYCLSYWVEKAWWWFFF